MRTIKFRAWDKKEKRMYPWNSIDLRLWIQFFENILGNFEIMQYTGLTDCLGKEIYEGDIVVFDNIKGDVRFNDGSFVIGEHEFISMKFGEKGWHWELVEIIGNIYEHPELIK